MAWTFQEKSVLSAGRYFQTKFISQLSSCCFIWSSDSGAQFAEDLPAGSYSAFRVAAFIELVRRRKEHMLGWALTFLVIAIVAALLGFTGIAGTAAGIAEILFFIFIVLFIIALVARAFRGKPPPM